MLQNIVKNFVKILIFFFFLFLFVYRHKVGYPSNEWEDEAPSKVQKILHFSITALSFLAFAGYLLCMIVQAIKSKGIVCHFISTEC